MVECDGGAVKEVRRLREQLDLAQDEARSIESILNGTDGESVKTDERISSFSMEERLESLHVSLEALHRQLQDIRKRVQQMVRQL